MAEKKGTAKSSSLRGQIFASVWIGVFMGAKFVFLIAKGQLGELKLDEVVFSGIAIAACFTPVYFSLFMDKIKNIRFGDFNNTTEEKKEDS